MNYGTSINGRQAIESGRAPASTVAAWIGCGLTAAWVRAHVPTTEWHHANVSHRTDGAPTNWYCAARAAGTWLAANYRARHTSSAARRRIRCIIARADGRAALDRDEMAAALADARGRELPIAMPRQAVVVEPVGPADLTRRTYHRSRGAFRAAETTTRIAAAEWRGDWLLWQGGRCRRDSVIRLVPVTAEQLAAAAPVPNPEQAARDAYQERVARRLAQRQKNIADLVAAYRRDPTLGRAEALKNYGIDPATIS
jgi:hypothetical protein